MAHTPQAHKLIQHLRRSTHLRGLARGAVMCLALLGLAGTAVAAPLASPGMLHPIGRWINLTMTQSARSAYLHAMLMDGYRLTPTMTIDER